MNFSYKWPRILEKALLTLTGGSVFSLLMVMGIISTIGYWWIPVILSAMAAGVIVSLGAALGKDTIILRKRFSQTWNLVSKPTRLSRTFYLQKFTQRKSEPSIGFIIITL